MIFTRFLGLFLLAKLAGNEAQTNSEQHPKDLQVD